MYDFNLAIKMYQIQLQNLMTANYLQNFRNGNNVNAAISPNTNNKSFDNNNKSESESSRKRKADGNLINELSNNNKEGDSSSYSGHNSPNGGGVRSSSKGIKLNSSQFKKSPKHTV